MTLCQFSIRGRPPCSISYTAVMDHSRHVVYGVSFVIKFWTDRMCTFGYIAIFRFCQFSFKMPIDAPFWWFFWGTFPRNNVTYRRDPRLDKRTNSFPATKLISIHHLDQTLIVSVSAGILLHIFSTPHYSAISVTSL